MDINDTVRGWFTRREAFYLLGAGCSKCAAKPLIDELTKQVIETLPAKITEVFENLRTPAERSPNIEDLMTHLTRTLELIASMRDVKITHVDENEIRSGLDSIRRGIAREIGHEWRNSENHERFFNRLISPQLCRSIFTINYDTVIEASLERKRIKYTDGFVGSEDAHFQPSLLSLQDHNNSAFILYKLHGSINWIKDDEGHIRRRPLRDIEIKSAPPSLVYPSEQKYIETQFGIYEIMFRHFRDRMREKKKNNTMICLGYSFNDEHINNAIVDAVKTPGCNLSIFAFLGSEDDLAKQENKLNRIAMECPTQINFYVGSKNGGFYIGDALERDESEYLLEMELWKFESLIGFLCGESQNE